MKQDYYTTAETAALFKVSPRTVQRWLREDPPRFPGARRASSHPNAPWLVPASDVAAELDRQEQEQEAEEKK